MNSTLGSVVSLAMFYLFSYQIIFLSKKSCPPQSWPLVGQVSKGWRGVGGARGQEHHHHRSQLQHQHLERTTTLSLESTTTSASSVIFSYWNIPKQLLIVVILPMVNYARALILVRNFKTKHMQCISHIYTLFDWATWFDQSYMTSPELEVLLHRHH